MEPSSTESTPISPLNNCYKQTGANFMSDKNGPVNIVECMCNSTATAVHLLPNCAWNCRLLNFCSRQIGDKVLKRGRQYDKYNSEKKRMVQVCQVVAFKVPYCLYVTALVIANVGPKV